MSTETAFKIYHHENPEVADEMERLADVWVESGRPRISVRLLLEVIRWNRNIKIKTGDEFKINNNFAPHYAREMIRRRPEWANRIDTRVLRAA